MYVVFLSKNAYNLNLTMRKYQAFSQWGTFYKITCLNSSKTLTSKETKKAWGNTTD